MIGKRLRWKDVAAIGLVSFLLLLELCGVRLHQSHLTSIQNRISHESWRLKRDETLRAASGTGHKHNGGVNRSTLDHKETTKRVSDPTGSTHFVTIIISPPPQIPNAFPKRSGTQGQFVWTAGVLNWLDWLKAPLSRCAWGICLGAVTVVSALIFRREKWIGQNFIPAVNSGDNGALGGQGWPRRLTHSFIYLFFTSDEYPAFRNASFECRYSVASCISSCQKGVIMSRWRYVCTGDYFIPLLAETSFFIHSVFT